MNSSSRSESGFTLLEVLISVVILIMISFAIYTLTFNTFKLRDELMVEGDFYNGVRLAMNIVERDVSLIFSPEMMAPEKPKKDNTQANNIPGQPNVPIFPPVPSAIPGAEDTPTTQYWHAPVDNIGIRPSRFVGEATKMSFISASHIRVYRESRESEFLKVQYDLQPDKDNPADWGTQTLVKTSSPNVFEEDEAKDTAKRIYPLLAGVKRFELKYFQKDKDDGVTSWDTENPDHKNVMPDWIELTLEVMGPSRLSYSGTYRFKPEIPLRGIDPSF